MMFELEISFVLEKRLVCVEGKLLKSVRLLVGRLVSLCGEKGRVWEESVAMLMNLEEPHEPRFTMLTGSR